MTAQLTMLLRRTTDLIDNVPQVMFEPYIVVEFKTEARRKRMVRDWPQCGVDIVAVKPNSDLANRHG